MNESRVALALNAALFVLVLTFVVLVLSLDGVHL